MAKKIYIAILVIFGLLTVFMGGSVLFDLFEIREKEGNYVPFVVAANFVCGFLYLIAAFGILTQKLWAKTPLIIAFIILIVTFIGLGFHINSGKIYETKTVTAMTFRTLLTMTFILTYPKIFKK